MPCVVVLKYSIDVYEIKNSKTSTAITNGNDQWKSIDTLYILIHRYDFLYPSWPHNIQQRIDRCVVPHVNQPVAHLKQIAWAWTKKRGHALVILYGCGIGSP
jgi:hypothetical protein